MEDSKEISIVEKEQNYQPSSITSENSLKNEDKINHSQIKVERIHFQQTCITRKAKRREIILDGTHIYKNK